MNYNDLCKNNNHDFGEWKKEIITIIENVGFAYLPVERIIWTRECIKCGAVQQDSKKPIAIEDRYMIRKKVKNV